MGGINNEIAPVSVIMISLNESHNIDEVCHNLKGWAQNIFLVDSFSSDDTIKIALSHGVHVVQNKFLGFGDQWNFALENLDINTPWTMKLDPDERLSNELKMNLRNAMLNSNSDAFSIDRRLWFMERPLPIYQNIVRIWRTGKCKFSNVSVNEYPIINGNVSKVNGNLEHFDSPNLEHWLEKQNKYTTLEAIIAFEQGGLSDEAILLGTPLQRRMWLKKNYYKIPFRYFLLFFYYWVFCGAWRAGTVGYMWSRLRSDVMRLVDYKKKEMEIKSKKIFGER
ncbi:glycosyltransferase family 2 protein [bacterium]|jgi:glycosyltransferase involved in cell wall biosynthesis|nr:glycosyltransferase family 2 protein [bacterium]